MENCLVTKLKASVDNDNLPILNTLKFFKDWVQSSYNTNYYINVTPADGKTLEASLADGKVFLDNSGNPSTNTLTITYSYFVHVPLDRCTMFIKNKADIKKVQSTFTDFTIPLSEFSYCTNIEIIRLYVSGDTKDISMNTKLVEFYSQYQHSISGNISDFGKCTSLEKLEINSNRFAGSIEAFVAAQRANGRTSVSSSSQIAVTLTSTPVTFNGGNASRARAANLYWDATTITYDGVTITA
jgi:hypothetical protein